MADVCGSPKTTVVSQHISKLSVSLKLLSSSPQGRIGTELRACAVTEDASSITTEEGATGSDGFYLAIPHLYIL